MTSKRHNNIGLALLEEQLPTLVNELQERHASDLACKQFCDKLDVLLSTSSTLTIDNLTTLRGLADTPANGIYWKYALAILESKIVDISADDSSGSEEVEEEEELEDEPEEESDDGEVAGISKTGWMSTTCDMSILDKRVSKLKNVPCLGPIFRADELVNKIKAGLKWGLAQIVKCIRLLTFADALDKFALWVKEHHSHRKAIVEAATFVEAVLRILAWILFVFAFILRPDKFFKKLLPDEVTDALPTE